MLSGISEVHQLC